MTRYGFEEKDLDAAVGEVGDTLAEVARGLGRIVYSDLAASVTAIKLNMGWTRDRAVLGEILGRIAEIDHAAGEGLRTTLVVSGGKTGTFEPNSQFFKWAEGHGYNVSDRNRFLSEQFQRIYQRYWVSRSQPQPEAAAG